MELSAAQQPLPAITLYWPLYDPPSAPGVLLGWRFGSGDTAQSTVVVAPCSAPVRCAAAPPPYPVAVWHNGRSPPLRLDGPPGAPRVASPGGVRLVVVLCAAPRAGPCLADDASPLRCLVAFAQHDCRPTARAATPSSALAAECLLRLSPPGRSLRSTALDAGLGLALGAVLALHVGAASTLLCDGLATLHQRWLERGAAWLATTKPAGVKLHAPLCAGLSAALASFVSACVSLGRLTAPCARPALALVALAGCAGASAQLSLASHGASLAGAPLLLLRRCARAWLRLHAAGLRNLWVKLYRPQRGAEGPQALRVERLTVGALLLTPMLLLAPTLCAYAALAEFAAMPVAVARAALRGAPAAVHALLAPRPHSQPAAWVSPLAQDVYALRWQ